MIFLTEIERIFNKNEAAPAILSGLSLSVNAGETVAILGESGSGKSTLLHIIAGLERPENGTVLVDGFDLLSASQKKLAEFRRSNISVIFQQFNLIPSLTVAGNIAMQARLAGKLDPAWIAELTDALGLAGHVGKYPEALSGGQQQRVAIGRALAVRPKVILADEPTGNLDVETGDSVIELLLKLVSETGATLVMVTHNPRLADRMQIQLSLKNGQLVP